MTRPGPDARRRHRLALAALALGSFLLSAVWAFASPVPLGALAERWGSFHPDESNHIAVVEYVAAHAALPPYTAEYATSIHPPLYHGAAAAVYALAKPALGREGALYLLRLLSAAMGGATVLLAYRAVRHLAGKRTALLAAALVALVPTRVALSGAVTNENLAALAASGALWAICAGLRRGFDARRTVALALWVAVAAGCKLTNLGLLPAALVAVAWDLRRAGRGAIPAAAARAALVVGATALAWGWWFARNQALYGDPVRKAAADALWDPLQPGFAAISAEKGVPAWRYLAGILASGWLSFWGAFDAMERRLPGSVYAVLLGAHLVALAGLARRALARRAAAWRPRGLPSRTVARAAMALFALYVLAVYVSFNWSHYTPQGRYFFVLLVPFADLAAAGWRAAWVGNPSAGRVATAALVGYLAGVNLLCLWAIPGW